jgi:TatD DNase family protein
LAKIERLAADPKVVAIGETGLDYHYDRSPRPDQRRSLAEHVELARALDMPVVLHVRDAHDEALEIVAEAQPRSEAPGMVHCFTAGPEEARRWLDLGFHISFSGIATFKTAAAIRDAARLVPADRILLETDAPYLSPEPLRGRKNQPAHVAFTCLRLASERGVDPRTLARESAQNTRSLLGLPPA